MMFFILFNYSMLRSLKDAIVTEVGLSLLALSKPTLFSLGYSTYPCIHSLCKAMDARKVLLHRRLLFVYLVTFSMFMFPNMESLPLSDAWAQSMTEMMPPLKWFIRVIQYWPHTSFISFQNFLDLL